MEVLNRIHARSINYLATRKSVLSDVVALAVLPYSRSLRERVDPEYQPRTRNRIVAAVGVAVALAPIWLARVNLTFSDGSGVSLGVVVALAEAVAIFTTSLQLHRKPV